MNICKRAINYIRVKTGNKRTENLQKIDTMYTTKNSENITEIVLVL